MRKFLVTLFLCVATSSVFAQIPNFCGTVGDSLLYGYTSVKFRPGINAQETYTTFQYGIGDHFAGGVDLYTGPGSAYWGFTARYGNKISKWFGVGAQFTPSFDLNDNFHFSYFTSGLYLNGAITNNGRLFWVSNTWWTINDGSDNSLTNTEYLAYNLPFSSKSSMTFMLGGCHDWHFDSDFDLAGGLYYTLNTWTFYLWGNNFLQDHPRAVLGIEFVL